MLTEPKGALAGNQALGMKGDRFGVAKTSLFDEDPYLVGGNYLAKPLGF